MVNIPLGHENTLQACEVILAHVTVLVEGTSLCTTGSRYMRMKKRSRPLPGKKDCP